jgi:hypothetical protein
MRSCQSAWSWIPGAAPFLEESELLQAEGGVEPRGRVPLGDVDRPERAVERPHEIQRARFESSVGQRKVCRRQIVPRTRRARIGLHRFPQPAKRTIEIATHEIEQGDRV